ncbi:MAG: hypothetical protein JRJ68_04425 [Deltaproteobacteria bacterium]|nr:hypothetical protein [Deltaproteobacteria bacterium]
MDSISYLIIEYKIWVAAGVSALLVLLCLVSSSFRLHIKKGIFFLLIAAGAWFGFYYITGDSPSDIPAEVEVFLEQPAKEKEPGVSYYRGSMERLKLPADQVQ